MDEVHVPPQPYFDINLRPLRTIVILDDMHSTMMKNELNKANKNKLLTEYFRCTNS